MCVTQSASVSETDDHDPSLDISQCALVLNIKERGENLRKLASATQTRRCAAAPCLL